MDNDENLLIQQLYLFDKFEKNDIGHPKIVFQMQIWDVPAPLGHCDKYAFPGSLSLLCWSGVDTQGEGLVEAVGLSSSGSSSSSCMCPRLTMNLIRNVSSYQWGAGCIVQKAAP